MTTKAQVLQVIRAHCMGCSGGSRSEVARCHLTDCALHPFRFGKDPNPSPGRGFAKSPVYESGSRQDGINNES
jgi:hypothetical protein